MEVIYSRRKGRCEVRYKVIESLSPAESEQMIPRELMEFFSEKGRILLIKGEAGTGKTSFGFRLLEELSSRGEVLWVNSREMDSSDMRELEAIIPSESKLDLSRERRLEKGSKSSLREGKKAAFDRPAPDGILDQLESEIARVESPTVVIDSFEGLGVDMTEEEKESLRLRIARLAKDTNANIAMIMEKPSDDPMDFLSDGIVTLYESDIEDRRLREMKLNKLRGTLIRLPKYLFTLEEGRFRCFSAFTTEKITRPVVPFPRPDCEDRIPTCIKALDEILGGGFERGSVNLIEIDPCTGKAYRNLLIPIFVNQLNRGRGFVYVPSGGNNLQTLERLISNFVGKGVFANQVATMPRFSGSHSYAREGKDLGSEIAPLKDALEKFSEKPPVLSFFGLDNLEHEYGIDASHSAISDYTALARRYSGVTILLAIKGQRLEKQMVHLADTYWKVQAKHGSMLLYGLVPSTELFYVSVDVTKGYIDTKLTPIQ